MIKVASKCRPPGCGKIPLRSVFSKLRPDGERLIYVDRIMSVVRALSFNGLANVQMFIGLNAGAHASPCFSGDTLRVWSEVIEKAATPASGIGALWQHFAAHNGGVAFWLLGEAGA